MEIDQAFVRRLDVVIDFSLPEAEERRLLALRHGEPVTAAEFADALQREYRKAGHPYPLASGPGRG
jgi:hypothetical protein